MSLSNLFIRGRSDDLEEKVPYGFPRTFYMETRGYLKNFKQVQFYGGLNFTTPWRNDSDQKPRKRDF